ncbi:penicillin acylase family protein [Pseudoduganella sp. OTU4001]|uniref:penicillin acylase family protein n=1 Tax=Pseudoduganella sp. OTU4001 TaxID=3043854 RepID=UPI00313B46DC
MQKVLRGVATSLVLLAGFGSASAETVAVAGLGKPARIQVDKWGVPHLYAASQDDLFFVQGFNAARDRLAQIDLWRRRGLGRMAAVFGQSYVEQDRAARLFLYRGDMDAEWKAYGPGAREVTERFVAGINAYIDLIERKPELLPFEFRQFSYKPEKWAAEDVVRIRSHGLTRNLLQEFERAHVTCNASLEADQIRARLAPAWVTQVPEGLDPCLPDNALDVFHLATAPARVMRDPRKADVAALDAQRMEGSNNWVIAPSRSKTGRPLLANDPHRSYATPSLRYIVHLNAPGLDAIGAGEPALPGISIGHNGRIAFGLTIFSIDQEDLYVYQTNPDNPRQYRYKDKWEDFRVLQEKVALPGGKSTTVELRFTRHGPVIFEEPGKKRALAVRSAWSEPGTAPYFGSMDYMRAQDVAQFRAAMARWGAPAENQVYADTAGNIGWVSGGLAPLRTNWDGLMPVPGDGRYEWRGFLDGRKLPWQMNPKQGWFASANEMNLPASFPYKEHKLGFEWAHESRAQRIAEVLGKPGKVGMEDMQRLQNDLVSIPARRVLAVLKSLKSSDANVQSALRLLGSWNAEVRPESGAAALFELWWSRHLGDAFKTSLLGKSGSNTMGAPDTAVLLEALEKPDARFGMNAVARRDKVLHESLAAAWAEMVRTQGADPARWAWGRMQFSYFMHPMSQAVDAATRAKLDVGPLPRGGSSFTVNQSGYHPANFWQINGPSFRVVIDVGGWDNSRAMNTPGQSGDPASPHYRDLASSWALGEYFPLLYSRKAVDAATERTIELVPARR